MNAKSGNPFEEAKLSRLCMRVPQNRKFAIPFGAMDQYLDLLAFEDMHGLPLL